MSQSPKLFPNAEPEGETGVPDDPTFISACMSSISDSAAKFGWRLGNSILTRSDVWGLVWRADFQTKGGSPVSERINRVICWGERAGRDIGVAVAFGRRVKRL